jgi:hypothetical protein
MTCALSDRLMQTLRVHTPGATDDLLSLELFNAADEFFRRSSAWRHDDEITLEENVTEYGFNIPLDSTVVRVMGVTHNEIPVPASAEVQVVQSSLGIVEPAQTFPDGDAAFDPDQSDLSNNIFSYAIYRPDYISFTKTTEPELMKFPIKVQLALSIAAGCLENDCGDWQIPDWMWDTYFQDWLDGTLARLYLMPAKPWSNATHATYHGKRFRNAMSLRKQEAMRGFVFAVPAWRFPRSGWV